MQNHPLKIIIPMLIVLAFGFGNAYAEDSRHQDSQPITVYKTPTCGCCQGWVDYLKTRGFRVETHDLDNLDGIKTQHGLTDPALKSCHTAIVDGYVVEGHVPAADIRRLLAEKPKAIGLAVPGMPIGSPGMEQGSRRDPYDVLLVLRDGRTRVFQAHRS